MDVTDSTFETAVLERSTQVPVVIDLWAEWCGPCRTLGPIIEKVVAETDGQVELVKVDVDNNPQISTAFRVQSIPAVYAVKDKQIVDSFIGAIPEPAVREFVNRLVPAPSEADQLVAKGDEESLRQALEVEPGHPGAVVGLAELLVSRGDNTEALSLLAKIPETPEVRRVAAQARLGTADGVSAGDDVERRLQALLARVKDDDAARQEYVDILETLGPDDARTAQYRKKLTAALF
jgi:putative thioredoxin